MIDDDYDDAVNQVHYSEDSESVSQGSSSFEVDVAGSTTQMQVCSLSPSTFYRFSVSAITRSGLPGPPAVRSYWTEVSAPPVPASPTLTVVMATSITLLLQPVASTSKLPPSIITYFLVVDEASDITGGARRKRQLSLVARLNSLFSFAVGYCG